jgi:hypothetical protein
MNAVKDRRPWNVGRMVGAKRALKPQQARAQWKIGDHSLDGRRQKTSEMTVLGGAAD